MAKLTGLPPSGAEKTLTTNTSLSQKNIFFNATPWSDGMKALQKPLPSPSSDAAKASFLTKLTEMIMKPVKSLIQSGQQVTHPFMTPEQREWQNKIDTYAESPFEKMLFAMRKQNNQFLISKSWADGIASPDANKRDASVTLFRAYLAYTNMEKIDQLSSHTQMKMLLFSHHLNEGPLGKAFLYKATMTLPLDQFLEFSQSLKRDFNLLPPVAQAIMLKHMLKRLRDVDPKMEAESLKHLKKLIKGLVVGFYTRNDVSMDEVLKQYEKIRLGQMKIKPVEEAYEKALEEIEKQYRFKLRQIRKRRSLKIAEAEEERQRRIELIYDSVERELESGLRELNMELEKVIAV